MTQLQFPSLPAGAYVSILTENQDNIQGLAVSPGGATTLLQPTWFIDPVNGNDANSGATLATALKSDAARQARWGTLARLVANTQYVVTYVSSPADAVNFFIEGAQGSSLLIQGQRTQTKSGTLSAVTTLNRATQTPWDVTSATAALGAGDVGNLIRITGGARAGNYARIVKALAANQVRISPFGTGTIVNGGFPDFFPEVTPQVNDPIEVVTLPSLQIGSMVLMQGTNAGPIASPLANVVQFDSLIIDGGTSIQGVMNSENVQCFFTQCILKNMGLAGPGGLFFIAGGGIDGVVFIVAGPLCYCIGTGIMNGQLEVLGGGYIALDGDTIVQGSGVFVTPSGCLDAALVSAFDCSNNTAFIVAPDGQIRSNVLFKGADLIWGTANAGHGVRVQSQGGLAYITKPTVNGGLGAGREAQVGGTDKLWTAVPFNDSGAAASGAIISAIA